MSVWFVIPSARPPEEAIPVLTKWRERGYRVAIQRDDRTGLACADLNFIGRPYSGYAESVNYLAKEVMRHDPTADWFVTGGDDVEPDANHTAEEIAAQCRDHFEGIYQCGGLPFLDVPPLRQGLIGVMQPTGDRWHEGVGGFTNAPIDRVCGSPWMGREFCRRMYHGNGPLFSGYQHMFEDEELQCVAEKLGVLWQRRDLIHLHKHWGRGKTDREIVTEPKIPPHLVKWNTAEHWQASKKLFLERKAAGFPGHEPL